LSAKPGWVRLSVHPTITDAEISFIMDAIEETAAHFEEWAKDYFYDGEKNEYAPKFAKVNSTAGDWFEVKARDELFSLHIDL